MPTTHKTKTFIMNERKFSTRRAAKNCLLLLIYLSSLEVLCATKYSKADFILLEKVPRESESEWENYMEMEEEEYTVEVEGFDSSDHNGSRGTGHVDPYDDGVLVNSVLFELLIFICCAAGVFGLCVLCCMVCGQLFDHSRDARRRINHTAAEEDLAAYMNNRAIRIQRVNDETILTFVSIHRNPWSPGVLEEEQEAFRFDNEESIDKPPPYEDLDLLKKPEEPLSPPPPPYTPSFRLPNQEVKQ